MPLTHFARRSTPSATTRQWISRNAHSPTRPHAACWVFWSCARSTIESCAALLVIAGCIFSLIDVRWVMRVERYSNCVFTTDSEVCHACTVSF